MTPRLEDGTIVLRAWRPADAERLAALSRDPEVPRWTGVPEDNTAELMRAFHADRAPLYLAGTIVFWTLCEGDEEPLGSIDLRVEPDHARADIGYWLGAPGRGRGLMTRAVKLVSDWGLGPRGLARIEIRAAVDNVASQRVAERAGFEREGVLRSYFELKGRREDLVMFSRLPER